MPDDPVPAPIHVRCEVTGREVPESETVVLDGKRVCMEGKAILLDRMRNSGAGEGEVVLHPGFWRRFGSLFIDGLVIVFPFTCINGVTKAAVTARETDTLQMTPLECGINAAAACAALVYFALMHGAKGQTLGKMACGLKVVNDDLSPITLRQAFFRAAWYKGPDVLMMCAVIVLLAACSPQLAGFCMIALGVAALIYVLVTVILALADTDKQRTIHDRATGTRVVRVDALNTLRPQA